MLIRDNHFPKNCHPPDRTTLFGGGGLAGRILLIFDRKKGKLAKLIKLQHFRDVSVLRQMSKPFLDIEIGSDELNQKITELNKKLGLIGRRFMAVAMDYQHYIDNTWGEKEIYELRDNVNYRFFSARLHLELLIRHHFVIKDRLERLSQVEPQKVFGNIYPSNPNFDYAQQEVSSIFDSILYHLVSVFDYLGTLTNYICGPGQTKNRELMWTKLANGARDSKNHFGKKPISKVIAKKDKEFVGRFYDYRSHLIHRKAILSQYSIDISTGKKTEINVRFIANNKLFKYFSELEELSTTHQLTTIFISFWIIEKSIDVVTDVLFGLKTEMETNRKVPHGIFVLVDPKTKKVKPISTSYWHEEEYKMKK